eukprot:359650-Chlamydomonas_euryale.AAC.5
MLPYMLGFSFNPDGPVLPHTDTRSPPQNLKDQGVQVLPADMFSYLGRVPNRPTDLPIYSKEFMKVEAVPSSHA